MDLNRCPVLEVVIGDDGQPIYQISGLGMVSRHHQLWQCETHWHALLAAKGLQPQDCPPIRSAPQRGPWPVPDPGT
jgi:hypothetical protein